MKHILKTFLVIIAVMLLQSNVHSQNCSTMNIQFQADIASTCNAITITMRQDIVGKPYLYVANTGAGLTIYDISTLTAPVLVKTISSSSFNSLDVINISQDGDYIYLALGNSFGTNVQSSGMAIVDVSNPVSAFVTDVWVFSGPISGAGIVKTEGNYAYLGAMGNGLIILDITDKNNISFVSQFRPDMNYPTANPDTLKYNARGMQVKNDIVYLCFDAGGFRIINTTNKQNPVETGRYSNPALNGKPRAYNNIILDDTLVYIAVDFCGLEVLNIADTSNVTLASWWNPWDCTGNPFNWFSSSGHANEIEYNKNCKQLFISTGKSDMYVVDISNPSQPDSCNYYGGISNGIGTWGIGSYQDRIYLSYICTFGIPFASNWTGVKILTYIPCTTGISEQENTDAINIFPIPSNEQITIETKNKFSDLKKLNVSVTNTLGQTIAAQYKTSSNQITLDISNLSDGIYFVRLSNNDKILNRKFIKSEF